MVVVILTGPKCSGKNTIAQILKSTQCFQHIDIDQFCTPTMTSLKRNGINSSSNKSYINTSKAVTSPTSKDSVDNKFKSIENLHLTASSLHSYRMQKFHELHQFLLTQYDKNIVISSLKHTCELKRLRSRPFIIAVAVDAPLLLRYQRYCKKFSDVTASLSLKKFAQYDALNNFGCADCICSSDMKKSEFFSEVVKCSQHHDFMCCFSERSGIDQCMKLCDFHLTNIGDMDHLRSKLNHHQFGSAELFRPSFDTHFVLMAYAMALRTNCIRRTVGAIITKDNKVVATGYNGTPTGTTNCLNGGCLRCLDVACTRGKNLDDCLCVHAEANALLQAGLNRSRGGTLYVTCFPCLGCSKLIIQGEIQRLVYAEEYDDSVKARSLLLEKQMEIVKYNPKPQKRPHLPLNI